LAKSMNDDPVRGRRRRRRVHRARARAFWSPRRVIRSCSARRSTVYVRERERFIFFLLKK
jgi:hypothetical protein